MIRVVVLVLLFAAGCDGCARSHLTEDGGLDGGVPDAGLHDGGRRDVPGRDAGAFLPDGDLPDGTDCSEVAGYRRCGLAQCPYLCPGRPPEQCSTRVPLCLSVPGSCTYTLGDPPVFFAHVCPNGAPCLLSGDPPAEHEQFGQCADVAICTTDYRDVDLPPYHCVWTDMTPVTRDPPAATCPPPPHRLMPFCGGACGDVECPESGRCAGLSDTRGVGICTRGQPCGEDLGPINIPLFDTCRDYIHEPCACAVFRPQPAEATAARGFFLSIEACRAYQRLYPDGVECRDASFALIPPG